MRRLAGLVMGLSMSWASAPAVAQPLGTFRWQLQPYCNVVTVPVTQVGGTYRLEGTDDGCGAAQAASSIGTAFLNPDGSIGIGLNIVTAPNGQPLPIFAALSLSTLSGTWRDEAGHTGVLALTAGAGTGGSPRPLPSPAVIPATIHLRRDGSLAAIQEWNYKTQDTGIRHMGPTAQDFRAAFGLGDFPLRINTIDADGVALAGVKALEVRTRDQGSRLDALARDNDALRERNGALARENEALRDRLDRLDRWLDRR